MPGRLLGSGVGKQLGLDCVSRQLVRSPERQQWANHRPAAATDCRSARRTRWPRTRWARTRRPRWARWAGRSGWPGGTRTGRWPRRPRAGWTRPRRSPEATILADPATLAGTIPGGPAVMTRVDPASLADPASPGHTIPVGRALPGRTPELPLRMRAPLHPTPAERLTPAAARREALQQAAATRPADRTLRLEALRLAAATPRPR